MRPIHISMSIGLRMYGIGARYSISWRAIRVSVVGTRVARRARPSAAHPVAVVVRSPERLDARLLEQAQHLGVVDVRVGVEVAPAQRDRDVDAGHADLSRA